MNFNLRDGFTDGFEGKPYIRNMSSSDDREYAREYGRGEYAAYYREMLRRFGSPSCSTCGARVKNQNLNKSEVVS